MGDITEKQLGQIEIAMRNGVAVAEQFSALADDAWSVFNEGYDKYGLDDEQEEMLEQAEVLLKGAIRQVQSVLRQVKKTSALDVSLYDLDLKEGDKLNFTVSYQRDDEDEEYEGYLFAESNEYAGGLEYGVAWSDDLGSQVRYHDCDAVIDEILRSMADEIADGEGTVFVRSDFAGEVMY